MKTMKKAGKILLFAGLPVVLVLFYALFTDSGRRSVMKQRILWKYRSTISTPAQKMQLKMEMQNKTLQQLKEIFIHGEVQTTSSGTVTP